MASALETFVFGNIGSETVPKVQDQADPASSSSSSDSEDDSPDEVAIKRPRKRQHHSKETSSAWVDDDDSKEIVLPTGRKFRHLKRTDDPSDAVSGPEYSNRLKQVHTKAYGTDADIPSWAVNKSIAKHQRFNSFTDDDSDEDLSNATGNFVDESAGSKRSSVLKFTKLRDVTYGHKTKNAIMKNVEFHKKAQILLAASESRKLMLFQIDAKENPLLKKIVFENFTIDTAHFSTEGDKIFVGSRLKPHGFYFDMNAEKIVKLNCPRSLNQRRMDRFEISPDGKFIAYISRYGFIHLLCAKSFEHVQSFKVNGEVSSLCFSSTGKTLYSHGDQGQIYVWDLDQRQCQHKFYDDGCVKGTTMAASSNGQFLAAGSNSGVVNLYDCQSIMKSESPAPIKSIMNLVTPISQLKFNGASEMLGICSEFKDSALRLVNMSSLKVYSNFPSRQDRRIKLARSLDFSINGGYFCVGNNQGQAMIYRLSNYASY